MIKIIPVLISFIMSISASPCIQTPGVPAPISDKHAIRAVSINLPVPEKISWNDLIKEELLRVES